jgi:hypothetical protein
MKTRGHCDCCFKVAVEDGWKTSRPCTGLSRQQVWIRILSEARTAMSSKGGRKSGRLVLVGLTGPLRPLALSSSSLAWGFSVSDQGSERSDVRHIKIKFCDRSDKLV